MTRACLHGTTWQLEEGRGLGCDSSGGPGGCLQGQGTPLSASLSLGPRAPLEPCGWGARIMPQGWTQGWWERAWRWVEGGVTTTKQGAKRRWSE